MSDAAEKPETLNESEFNMWRTLFALTHADDVVTDEERKFMENALDELNLTDYQRSLLVADTMEAADIGALFQRITDQNDRVEFFRHARALVWCDGDFDQQEQEIIAKLKNTHVQSVDFFKLIEDVTMSFDEEEKECVIEEHKQIEKDLDTGDSDSKLNALRKLFRAF